MSREAAVIEILVSALYSDHYRQGSMQSVLALKAYFKDIVTKLSHTIFG